MSNKFVIAIVVVLIVILALVLRFAGNDGEGSLDGPVVVEENPTPDELTPNHYFVESEPGSETGSHTVEGVITLPTPCHSIKHEVLIAESYPEKVTIALTIIEPDEGVVCVQSIAEKFYSVVFDAHKDATISATINGDPAILKFSEDFEGITK